MSTFMNEAVGLIPPGCTSSWDHLFLMQHHGVPTRLLDWTESWQVAVYFAVRERLGSPTLWVLNPFKLNDRSVEKRIVFDKSDAIHYDYYETITKSGNVPHKLPVCMLPPWASPRIRSQRACFTVHGSDPRPIEKLVGDRTVKKICIPEELVSAIEGLIEVDFNEFRLFPDLDGLSRSLLRRYAL